ncbi:MAG: ClpP-like prohead protease/major capsid protein fusion protein [Mizugakiibacter sp.]|uniref:ClpP-like prohead protease/major capsid protein fusion protein n=1 Tax=Mizugakiibacter sp. TaxID=1972610 RepID=UPI0032101024
MKWYRIKAQANQSAEVLIYGDIGENWWGDSVVAKEFIQEINALDVSNMAVRINSFGGSVSDGVAIFNALRRHKATVTTSIDGAAYSIASLIAMAGDVVEMAENAMLMVHAPWTGLYGNAVDLRDAADMLDKMAEAMMSSYNRGGRGPSIADIEALLKDGQDHWYTAAEALDAGFIDQVVAAMPMAAAFKQNRFTPPAAAAASTKELQMPKPNVPAADLTQPAAAVQPAPAPAPAAPAVSQETADALANFNAQAAAEEALAKEHLRRSEIRAVFAPFTKTPGVEATMNQYLDNPKISVEAARANLLATLGRNAEPLGGGLVMTVEDEGDKFRMAVGSGLLIRAGLVTNDTTNEYRGYSLLELARAQLRRANVSTKGMDKMSVVAAAFTHSSSDFGNILADVANKAMLKGYMEADETFQMWTSAGTLPDFKTAKRVDLNTFPALPVVKEGAEYKYVNVGDRGETIALATYGSLFSITRQAIINDDLNAFTRVPNKMGRAAIRTVGNLVYAILTGNPNMSDGVALFDAGHSNLVGTGTVLSSAAVDALGAMMAKQKDATGNTLNINMAYLIVPRVLKGLAMQIANSEFEVGASTSTKNNTVPNQVRGAFEVIADARLDGDSLTAWYGAASPVNNDTIEVAYLDGNQAPTLEQQGGWDVDGVEFKVRIDAGVSPLDFRGLAKNPGA